MKLKNVCNEFKYGKIIFPAGDSYIGTSLALYGEYSEGEVQLYKQFIRKGQTVVEVGSNIGSLTIPIAQFVGEEGKVYAFEPQRLMFQILCGNMALNNLQNVYCYNKGAGDKNTTIKIVDKIYEEGANIGAFKLEEKPEGYEVDVVTLDSFNIPSVDFLKVDVEGMELQVLQGAEKLIEKFNPIIYLEIDNETLETEKQWLKAKGYKLYRHTVPLFNPNNYFNVKRNAFIESGKTFEGKVVSNSNPSSFNMIAIPSKRNIVMKNFEEL